MMVLFASASVSGVCALYWVERHFVSQLHFRGDYGLICQCLHGESRVYIIDTMSITSVASQRLT